MAKISVRPGDIAFNSAAHFGELLVRVEFTDRDSSDDVAVLVFDINALREFLTGADIYAGQCEAALQQIKDEG